ncbi:autotransporter outer membrane beta-barrel domain-containing protein [Haemophilus sp. oral taxon 851]|uniref:autotransporter outer membrane beta-barrel domain-containing protein n=1 Tax=Haemophilus sp. oral taxon 851 TaxID=762964 RepID=UPI0002462248|nr:autotransporter outer membrane beta-barrel domain-containing protein [Haemophilus sp. oral taxon 851]EHO49246.1 outer membrane autotransporter barrel domain protein [Haemophilus sp. oral taxon 851 str. F0397]
MINLKQSSNQIDRGKRMIHRFSLTVFATSYFSIPSQVSAANMTDTYSIVNETKEIGDVKAFASSWEKPEIKSVVIENSKLNATGNGYSRWDTVNKLESITINNSTLTGIPIITNEANNVSVKNSTIHDVPNALDKLVLEKNKIENTHNYNSINLIQPLSELSGNNIVDLTTTHEEHKKAIAQYAEADNFSSDSAISIRSNANNINTKVISKDNVINAGLGISLSSSMQGPSNGNGSFLPAQPTQSVFLESTNDTLNTIDGVYMLDILTNAKFDHAKINAKDTAVSFNSSERNPEDYDYRQPNKKYEKSEVQFSNSTIEAKTAFKRIFPIDGFGRPYELKHNKVTLDNSVVKAEVLARDDKNSLNYDVTPMLDVIAQNSSRLEGKTIGLHHFTINDSSWTVRGDSTVNTLSTKNANIHFDNKDDSLTVKNDYDGGARFYFDADFTNRKTNELTFKGKVTGITEIVLNSYKGLLENANKHKLINVEGESNNDAFKLHTRYTEGEHELFLRKCEDEQNWCFFVDNKQEEPGKPEPDIMAYQNNDNVAIYAQNTEFANKVFNLRLHDRLGDVFMQNTEKRMWLRAIQGSHEQKLTTVENKTKGFRHGIQLGGDIWSWKNIENYAQFGVMAGFSTLRTEYLSPQTNVTTKGSSKGYSLGLYGTWYQNKKDNTGAYVDSWVQYNWFHNRIAGPNFSEKYRSQGFNASIETGYNFLVSSSTSNAGNQYKIYIQPQLQLTYMGIKDQYVKSVNALVHHNLQTRTGVKAYFNAKLINGMEIQPFLEMNLLKQAKRTGVVINNQEYVVNNKNAKEIKVGVDFKVNNNIKLWGSFAHQLGNQGYKDKQGLVGLKITF